VAVRLSPLPGHPSSLPERGEVVGVPRLGVNVAMILFGLAMEYANPPGAPVDWRPFLYGCIAGAVPWIAIATQIGYAQAETGSVPGFVFGIFGSLLVLLMSFAVNMALQYRRRGRWQATSSATARTWCSA
jgi:hypothetical protein